MADRCEHGARRGQCDEQHPTAIEIRNMVLDVIEKLEDCLDNLTAFNTKKMDGVDVIALGHVETHLRESVNILDDASARRA